MSAYQPNKKQWGVIWIVAAAVVLLWPGETGSLGIKASHLLADPFHHLPVLPPPIPFGFGDDADIVMAHDAQEQAYYDAYESSAVTRFRIGMREWQDPLAPATQRQVLVALAVFGMLLVWRLADRGQGGAPAEEADGAT